MITSDTSQIAQSPISPYLWHDVFSFGLYSPQYQTSANGTTYNAATLNNALFAQKQAQNIEIINGTTIISARWIWTGVSFNDASWLVIGFTYIGVTSTKTIVFETSTDNVSWTVRHTSSNSNQSIPIWFYISPFGGDTYARLTITTTNAASVRISSIRLLTSRWGDQGLGSEIEFPYDWNGNKNIGIGGNADASYKLNVVGTNLGTTLGNQSLVQRLQVNTGNVDLLELTNTRVVNGNTWQSAGFRIQQKVDTTWLGYLQFNGGNDAGVSFGTGFGASATSVVERMRITSAGNVLINTITDSGFRLDVSGTTRVSGVLTLGSTISNGTFTYTLPGATGTLALTSQIPTVVGVYLPLAGGTLTGALNGTSATFNSNITTTGATAEIIANGAGSSNTVGGSSRFTIRDSTNNRGWILQQDATYDLAFWHLNGGAWTNNIIFSPTGTISVNGESTYIGTDAQAVPRLGFVKISGQDPFLGFASSPFTIRVSSGANIATSNTFTNALSIATTGAATFSSTVSATDYYFNSTSVERAVKRYVSTANVSNGGYTVVCNVTGNALASAVRMTFQGTTGSVVINVTADILVNHFQDILITSQAGIYTLLTLRVISNNDENFSVSATSDSPNVCTMNVEVYPLNNETVTFGGSFQTGSSLTHVCTPGVKISAIGGSNGDFTASGNGTFGGTLGVGGVTTLSNLAGTGNRIVGADSSGILSSITVGSGLSLSAGTLIATGGSAGTVTGSGSSSQVSFWTSGSNISGDNGFIWDNTNKRLGVGTTSPLVKLQITQALDGSYPTLGTTKGAFFIAGDTNLYGLYVGVNTTDGNSWFQAMRNNTATAYNIILQPAGGNVLIGTTTDAGYKLDVNGTGRFSGSVTATSFTVSDVIINSNQIYRNSASEFYVNYSGTGHTLLGNGTGNVGINAGTNPSFRLDVGGTGRFTGNLTTNGIFIGRTSNGQAFGVGNGVDSDLGIFVQTNNIAFSNSSATSGFSFAIGGSTRLSIASSGAATFSSSVTATSFFESSDKRLKKEISDKPIISGIEAIKPKLYIKDGKEELGYYAQDLQEVLPSAVSEGQDGFLSLSYSQVLVAKVASLEKRIMELESKLK